MFLRLFLVLTTVEWTLQHLAHPINYCDLATTCLHDKQPVCGSSANGCFRNFLDQCDMYEYNCDHGEDFAPTVPPLPIIDVVNSNEVLVNCQKNTDPTNPVTNPTTPVTNPTTSTNMTMTASTITTPSTTPSNSSDRIQLLTGKANNLNTSPSTPTNYCELTKTCSHDNQPICGKNKKGCPRKFQDLCQMYEYNCHKEDDYVLYTPNQANNENCSPNGRRCLLPKPRRAMRKWINFK